MTVDLEDRTVVQLIADLERTAIDKETEVEIAAALLRTLKSAVTQSDTYLREVRRCKGYLSWTTTSERLTECAMAYESLERLTQANPASERLTELAINARHAFKAFSGIIAANAEGDTNLANNLKYIVSTDAERLGKYYLPESTERPTV